MFRLVRLFSIKFQYYPPPPGAQPPYQGPEVQPSDEKDPKGAPPQQPYNPYPGVNPDGTYAAQPSASNESQYANWPPPPGCAGGYAQPQAGPGGYPQPQPGAGGYPLQQPPPYSPGGPNSGQPVGKRSAREVNMSLIIAFRKRRLNIVNPFDAELIYRAPSTECAVPLKWGVERPNG